MNRSFKPALWLCAALACLSCLPVYAAVIVNGGFEADFTGWTTVDQVGSDGTFFLQTGTTSPLTGLPVPAPSQGTTAAMTDAQGPGSHVLFQEFTATAPVPTTFLSFDLFIGNRHDAFISPDTLDFAAIVNFIPVLNQQARVDILVGGSDPFSLSSADVLLNLFQTDPGDPVVSGYTHFSFDVTALLNGNLNTPLRLRFAEVDNVNIFNFGVDNVSLAAAPVQPVPEPASYLLAMSALLALMWARRRNARARARR